MIVLLYLGVVLACAFGDNAIEQDNWVAHFDGEEVARGVDQELGLTYQDKGVQQDRQQLISERSNYHVSVRAEDVFNDKTEQGNLNVFLKSVNGTDKLKNCKTGTYACVEFPSRTLEYLAHLGQTDVAKLGTFSTKPAYETTLSTYSGPTKHLDSNPNMLSSSALKFNDPDWRKQWPVQDYRTSNIPVMDHNIVPVLNMGYTGLSITVGVLGDGVSEHPDLAGNYETSISYNFCDNVKGSNPDQPVPSNGYTYAHHRLGTGSAGVIAMRAGNGVCGVGIAPNARIAGLKISKCKDPKPEMEAKALIYSLKDIDIYCNTWTSEDLSGSTLVNLESTVEQALKEGTTKGRKDKGAIYVFPSGRNGPVNHCATNGYVNNPYVITIGSASSDGFVSSYSERCTAVFAAAYSGDKYTITHQIATINADGKCANYPYVQPAAPAVASGIIALVLQANPALTYRDMMHLIAMTSEVAPLANIKNSWYRNGRGFWVSSDYGFGLLNAENMVALAKDWKTVPNKNICIIKKRLDVPLHFDDKESKSILIDASGCNGPTNGITYLEHVELVSSVSYHFRGAVFINITSPAGTESEILEPRIKDFSTMGFNNWNIMSVHNWGENPKGLWNVTVMACQIKGVESSHGTIQEFTLKLRGTQEQPKHYDKPRKYAAFRLPNGNTNRYV